MIDRYRRANPPTTELVVDHVDDRGQRAMQASVAAGACVALADGRLENACVGAPGSR
jgi:hypothetical protein